MRWQISLREMPPILRNATDISMDWSDPELNGTIVRRDVSISFTTGSFDEAGDLIKQIADCEYALLIVDMSMDESKTVTEVAVNTPQPTEVPDDTEVEDSLAEITPEATPATTTIVNKETTVHITIRFFETTDGAVNLNGLTQPTPEVTVEEDDDGLPSTAELNEQINGD